MNEATTEQVVDHSVADNSSTTEPTTTSADSQTTENASTTGVVTSDATAGQNQSTESDDNALAKFAKGQGINDLSELSERELSFLKMARDNKSALDRTKQNQPRLEETSTVLSVLGEDATDVQRLAAKVANMEYKGKKTSFFEGKDAALEPVMSQIVTEKRKEFGDDYARNLLNDLPTLYGLAQLNNGFTDTKAAVEAAKREERDSMNRSLAAGASDAHATDSKPATPAKITNDWIMNEYDSTNPEHRALVDAATKTQ